MRPHQSNPVGEFWSLDNARGNCKRFPTICLPLSMPYSYFHFWVWSQYLGQYHLRGKLFHFRWDTVYTYRRTKSPASYQLFTSKSILFSPEQVPVLHCLELYLSPTQSSPPNAARGSFWRDLSFTQLLSHSLQSLQGVHSQSTAWKTRNKCICNLKFKRH